MELLETFSPALIVAFLGLMAAAWHGRVTRRHQRMCLRPLLCFVTDFRRTEHNYLNLVNKGVGPAIVRSLEAWVKDKPIRETASGGVVRAALTYMKFDKSKVNTWTVDDRTVLEPSEVIALVRTRDRHQSNEDKWELRKALMKLELLITYESVYGERFDERLGNKPRELEQPIYDKLELLYGKDTTKD